MNKPASTSALGIVDQIRAASTKTAIAACMTTAESFKYISPKTLRKVLKIGTAKLARLAEKAASAPKKASKPVKA